MRNITVAATKESKALSEAIYRYGCITLDQLAYFMPPSTRKTENYHSVICNHLIAAKMAVKTDNNVVYPYINKGYSQPMIDSIWVMIDLLNDGNTDVHLSEKLEVSFRIEYPETLCFIKDCTDTVKLLPIETASQIPLISFVQDRFYVNTNAKVGEESKKKSVTIITIRDKNLLSEIGKLGIAIPHKIAYLEGNPLEKPTITYYGNASKK